MLEVTYTELEGSTLSEEFRISINGQVVKHIEYPDDPHRISGETHDYGEFDAKLLLRKV